MKKLLYIVIGIAVIRLIAFILMNNKRKRSKNSYCCRKNASVSVKIDTVKTEEISLDFVSNGNFEPIQELKFSAEKSGKVVKSLLKKVIM